MSDGLLHFQCPVCGRRLATLASHAEQAVRCPLCESRMEVPIPQPDRSPDHVYRAEEQVLELHRRASSVEAEMDMTPMVDMTFLLLIFFMVTASFAMQKSFEMPAPDPELPSSNYQANLDDDVVTVRIDEFNTFHVFSSLSDEEHEAPNEQELLRRMREAKAGQDGGPVANKLLVEAHGDALHAAVVTVMDAGNEIGFESVQLRTVDEID